MVQLHVKKLGKIPNGGGRWAHGRGSTAAEAGTTIGFFARARAFFTANGITCIHRVVTNKGANYCAKDLTGCVQGITGSAPTRPITTE